MAAINSALAAPPYLAPSLAPYSWTGFYVGGNAGYSWGSGDFTYNESAFGAWGLPTSISTSKDLDGAIGGLQTGYNWQFGNAWVAGLETDFQWSGEKASTSFSDPYTNSFEGGVISGNINSKLLWFGTVRGRVGVLATPAILIYTTGGLAYGRVETSGTITDTWTGLGPYTATWSFGHSETRTGWTVGGGVEGAIMNSPWTWKVEYLYMDLGSIGGSGYESDPNFTGSYNWTTKFTDNIVRFGVNYRFP
jgi:outer membrane immunogenic protein